MTERIKCYGNSEMWAKADELKENGYKRVANAYWVEIFRNGEDEVILERCDEKDRPEEPEVTPETFDESEDNTTAPVAEATVKALRGSAKEIRQWVADFIEMSKEGKGKSLNDYIAGIDKDGNFLWCVQLSNDYDENCEEYANIDLRSTDLVEVNVWEEIRGVGGVETRYLR